MDPADIKAEMLKKYPPKVARKRAKQIMINEALDNDTPEITANVRTIPGIITMRGCTYAGCKGVILGPTRDIVNITHGPIGCGFYSWLTRRNQTDASGAEDGELHDLLLLHGHAGQGHHLRRREEAASRPSRRPTTCSTPRPSPSSPPARWG